MKPASLRNGRILLVLLMAGLTLGLVSWDHRPSPGRIGQSINDTTPKNKTSADKKIRDLDQVYDELNSGEWKEDLQKAMKELKETMKDFDTDKIKLQIEQAFKDIDLSKMKLDLKEAMKEFDSDKIKLDLELAMKDIDLSKISADLRSELAKINWDNIKVEVDKMKDFEMKDFKIELDKLKEIDFKDLKLELEQLKLEMKDLQPKLEKELEGAKHEIELAKKEIKAYKDFVDGLEKDGLLNKKDGYKLKHEDGELFINGKKASAETYNKYRTFLEKHKKFNIQQSDDDFRMDLD